MTTQTGGSCETCGKWFPTQRYDDQGYGDCPECSALKTEAAKPGNEFDNPFWHSQRIDEDRGDIRYEAHGPHHSFVVFHGPQAREQCEAFMGLMAAPAEFQKEVKQK